MKNTIQPQNNDLRVGGLIKPWDGQKADVGILGLPFDYGVELSGGRTGAKEAPAAIRERLKRYGTAYNIEKKTDISKISIADLGDANVVEGSSEETHRNVFDAVQNAMSRVSALITIGGGNDLSYATIKALSYVYRKKIGGINIDAHFDVRSVVNGRLTSGTPYWRLLEEKILNPKNFCEFAVQGHVNAKVHYDWLKKQGVKICFLSEARKKGAAKTFGAVCGSMKDCRALFVSLDIDAVAQAFAPGSSAPNPDGLFPEDILAIVFMAGQNKKVKLFEIMEVNPKYDADNRTSRLAANIINEFLAGFSRRK